MRSVSDKGAGTPDSPDDDLSGQQLFNCNICGEQFASKKQLRVHIHTHLRESYIVLRRVTSPKVVRLKRQNDTYWLDPEKKGSLKLTLKKQTVADPLKLTLKKSNKSKDFTVVNSNFRLSIGNLEGEDVAGAKENERRDDKAAESSDDESFENMMVDQQVSFTVLSRRRGFLLSWTSLCFTLISFAG